MSDTSFLGKLHDAGSACMAILHVVDRILGGFARCEFEVEVHLAVGRPRKEEEPARILAYLFDHIGKGNDVSCALGQLDDLIASAQDHELVEDDGQASWVDTDGLHGRLHASDVTLMIGPPDIDHLIEATGDKLVPVVGDVRGHVARCAVAPDQHVVAIITECGT